MNSKGDKWVTESDIEVRDAGAVIVNCILSYPDETQTLT